MSTVTNPNTAERRVVLHEVSWSTFQALARESRGGRLTYDRGALEIMSPSRNHELTKRFLGRMAEIFAQESNVEISPAGSMTLSRESLQRGIESDESYYIASLPQVIDQAETDLEHDPPPDLVIEVDITRSSINKLDICRELGVPEVWRFDQEKLEVYVLGNDGTYDRRQESGVLPGFPVAGATVLLSRRNTMGLNQWDREFRALVKESR